MNVIINGNLELSNAARMHVSKNFSKLERLKVDECSVYVKKDKNVFITRSVVRGKEFSKRGENFYSVISELSDLTLSGLRKRSKKLRSKREKKITQYKNELVNSQTLKTEDEEAE